MGLKNKENTTSLGDFPSNTINNSSRHKQKGHKQVC